MTTTQARARWRWLFALLAAFALVAAACGDDEDGDTDTEAPAEDEAPADEEPTDEEPAEDEGAAEEPAEGDDVERTASFRGVTEDTIAIGVSFLDFEFLVANNFSPNGWGDQQLVYEHLIDRINEGGGINGRMIEVVAYEPYSPIGTVEAEEVCTRLTQDNEIFLVLGGFLGPAEDANPCITETNETALVGGALNADLISRSVAPVYDFRASTVDATRVMIELLDSEGEVEGTSIYIINRPNTAGELEAAKEALDEVGANVVGEAEMSIDDGDQVAQDAQMATISEQVRAAGADTVLIIGNPSPIIRGMGAVGLTGELDAIWTNDRDGLRNLGESVNREDARGVVTIDRLTPDENWADPLMVECAEDFKAAHPDIEVKDPADVAEGEDAWYQAITSYCTRTALMVKLLEAAGPNPTYETLVAGAESLGEFQLPGQPNASLGPGKFYTDDSFRLSEFDPDEGDKGDVVAITDILDAAP